MRRIVVVVLAGVTLALALSGCSQNPPKIVFVTKQAPMAAPGAPITGKKLPADFPTDVPLYPGAVATLAQRANVNGRLEYDVSFISSTAYDKVLDGMLRGITAAGWKVAQQVDLTQGSTKGGMIEFKKGTTDVVVTLGVRQAGGTTISYVVTKPH